MRYEVVSDKPCLIDAVGEMVPGQPVVLDEMGAEIFQARQGYKITQANFPDFITVTVSVEE